METLLMIALPVQVIISTSISTNLSYQLRNLINFIKECSCNVDGSLNSDGSKCTSTDKCPCNTDGICTCKIGYTGDKCDECEASYFNLEKEGFNCIGKSQIYSYRYIFVR